MLHLLNKCGNLSMALLPYCPLFHYHLVKFAYLLTQHRYQSLAPLFSHMSLVHNFITQQLQLLPKLTVAVLVRLFTDLFLLSEIKPDRV